MCDIKQSAIKYGYIKETNFKDSKKILLLVSILKVGNVDYALTYSDKDKIKQNK